LEQKNSMLVALVTAAIISAAVLSSFFLPLFFGSTPKVQLPDISAPLHPGDDPGQPQDPGGGNYVRVEVTPETVQNVIDTLDRPVSYYRELAVETIWGEGERDRSTADIRVWTDGGFTKTETSLPGGFVRHRLVGNDTEYLWYGNEKSWYETGADDLSADLAQHIPTYEDILSLDRSAITDTGYEVLDGLSCIYVETENDLTGYLERYWVDVQSGLLVSAETVKDGMVVYRMISHTLELPIPQDAAFMLPDGTVLHQVSQT